MSEQMFLSEDTIFLEAGTFECAEVLMRYTDAACDAIRAFLKDVSKLEYPTFREKCIDMQVSIVLEKLERDGYILQFTQETINHVDALDEDAKEALVYPHDLRKIDIYASIVNKLK